jgi:2-keto-4-pentenoate hydratase
MGCAQAVVNLSQSRNKPRNFDRGMYQKQRQENENNRDPGTVLFRRFLYWNEYVNCAIEPEMVLKIGKDLKGYNLPDEILIDAIKYVSPGLEIHNYKFWYAPVTSQELICSNGIHAGLVVGKARVLPEDLSFKTEIFEVLKKGRLIATAPASEIMGGPLNSLRWLIGFLTKKGRSLEPDTFVIPGSPVELIPINEDTELTVKIGEVESITKKFGKRLFGDH